MKIFFIFIFIIQKTEWNFNGWKFVKMFDFLKNSSKLNKMAKFTVTFIVEFFASFSAFANLLGKKFKEI
jgi:hypothetical protein